MTFSLPVTLHTPEPRPELCRSCASRTRWRKRRWREACRPACRRWCRCATRAPVQCSIALRWNELVEIRQQLRVLRAKPVNKQESSTQGPDPAPGNEPIVLTPHAGARCGEPADARGAQHPVSRCGRAHRALPPASRVGCAPAVRHVTEQACWLG